MNGVHKAQRACEVNLLALPRKNRQSAKDRIRIRVAQGWTEPQATEAAFREELVELGFDPRTGRPRR